MKRSHERELVAHVVYAWKLEGLKLQILKTVADERRDYEPTNGDVGSLQPTLLFLECR